MQIQSWIRERDEFFPLLPPLEILCPTYPVPISVLSDVVPPTLRWFAATSNVHSGSSLKYLSCPFSQDFRTTPTFFCQDSHDFFKFSVAFLVSQINSEHFSLHAPLRDLGLRGGVLYKSHGFHAIGEHGHDTLFEYFEFETYGYLSR